MVEDQPVELGGNDVDQLEGRIGPTDWGPFAAFHMTAWIALLRAVENKVVFLAMARRSKYDPYDHLPPEEEVEAAPVPCWLCGRPMGKTIVWHHPVPKSRGGRDVVPMHPICQQTLTVNFSNSELQRHGMNAVGLLDCPNVRKFVDWVAKKDPDFTATITKKQR